MGVQGLWQLLDPLGRPVTLERLENKVLAIDASIWLHQAVHGFRDQQGNPLPNAHLMGFFHRLCKLLFYCIKPVFVFDGSVPELKRKTMAARRDRQQTAVRDVEKARQQILQKHIQSLAIRQALADDAGQPLPAGSAPKAAETGVTADLFELPPLPPTLVEEVSSSGDSDGEHSDSWMAYRSSIFQNLDDLDFDSADFRALPLDIQHEFLLEIKERNRRRSFIAEDSMPKDPEKIGNFQIRQLLRRRKVQRRLDDIDKNVSAARTSDIIDELDSDLRDSLLEHDGEVRRINSEDSAHYFLFKRIHRTMERHKTAKEEAGASTSGWTRMDRTTNPAAGSPEEATTAGPSRVDFEWTESTGQALSEASSFNNQMKEVVDLTFEDVSAKLDSNETCKVDLCKNMEDVLPVIHPSKQIFGMSADVSTKLNSGDTISSDFHNSEADVSTRNKLMVPEPVQVNYKESKDLISSDSAKNLPSSIADADAACVSEGESGHSIPTFDSTDASCKIITGPNFISKEDPCILNLKSSPDTNPSAGSYSAEQSINIVAATSHCGKSRNDPTDGGAVVQRPSTSSESFFDALPKMPKPLESGSEDDDDFIEVEPESDAVSPDRRPISTDIFAESDDGDDVVPVLSTATTEAGDRVSLPLVNEDTRDPLPPFISAAMDRDELRLVGEELDREAAGLQREKGSFERVAVTIADQAYAECQELLRLFGVPFVVSPAEAEAQCAVLDRAGLTEGTVTEDSDVWLFGATRVYKNFFERDREVTLFTESDILRCLRLDRSKLIALALLTGSDYTEGVRGVGVVTAVEVLAEFPDPDGVESLKKLHAWWTESKLTKPGHETKIKQNLRKVELSDGFPNPAVVRAYLEPLVDHSEEPFSWSPLDLDALRTFGRVKLGWSKEKVDDLLLPVIKRMSTAKERQTRIDGFFHPVTNIKAGNTGRRNHSQRLKRALRKVQPQESDVESVAVPAKSTGPVSRRRAATRPRKDPRGKTLAKAACATPVASASKSSANLNLSEDSSDDNSDDCDYIPKKRKC